MDIDFATASELTQAIRDRAVSSRELLEHLLARVESHNPELNAIVAFDVDRARVAAQVADTATVRGDPVGLSDDDFAAFAELGAVPATTRC